VGFGLPHPFMNVTRQARSGADWRDAEGKGEAGWAMWGEDLRGMDGRGIGMAGRDRHGREWLGTELRGQLR
jgi:hypothetical protein